jgi:hypothetical protein
LLVLERELLDILNSRAALISGKTLMRWVRVMSKIFAEVNTKLLSLLLKYFPGFGLPPASLTADRTANLDLTLSLGGFLRKF